MIHGCLGIPREGKEKCCSRQGRHVRRGLDTRYNISLCSVQDSMRISTAITERIDAGSAYMARRSFRPRRVLGHYFDTPLLCLDFGVYSCHPNGLWNQALFKSQGNLDDTRDSTGRLTMAEIGFDLEARTTVSRRNLQGRIRSHSSHFCFERQHEKKTYRANQKWIIGSSFEHAGYGLHLDRVTNRCAGPVSLNIICPIVVETCLGICLADDGFLSSSTGQGDTRCFSIATIGTPLNQLLFVRTHSTVSQSQSDSPICRGSPDHGPNRIAVPDRVAQALHQKRANAFCSTISICRVVECVAGRRLREHPGFHRAHMLLRGLDQVCTCDYRRVALSRIQSGASDMQAVE